MYLSLPLPTMLLTIGRRIIQTNIDIDEQMDKQTKIQLIKFKSKHICPMRNVTQLKGNTLAAVLRRT
jgi:hypothetical protein